MSDSAHAISRKLPRRLISGSIGAGQDTQDCSYSFLTPFNIQRKKMTKMDQINCKSANVSAFTDAYGLSHYLMPQIKNTIQSVSRTQMP